jgi:molecular chaperone DnaK
MEKIFGIDLGTTNSEIAYMENGKPVLVPIDNGVGYLPSVVGVGPDGNIVTGFPARNLSAAFPENTVISIKRKMGSGETIRMAGKSYTPAEISSFILKTLKDAAERETGGPVRKAVITVPAYFTDLQRKDTIQAGELAGLEVVRIINEPTAAALAYGCREDGGEKILVYDLGGGTFDVSLMHIEENVLEVLATDGDTFLGGDDFDALVKDYFLSLLPKGSVAPEDRKTHARLTNAAEQTKIALSTSTVREVREEFVASHEGRPVHLELTVTRAEFESLIEEKLSKTFRLVDRVLGDAKVREKDISKVLLVGGSTYIPRIFEVLSEARGFSVHREVDPTFAVALGAAIQGGIIAGEPIDTILVDVNSHSLGIRAVTISPSIGMDFDHYSVIIHRNTPIPTTMGKTFHTIVDGQSTVEIEAFQGEQAAASLNTFIGSFKLADLPKKLPAGSEIDVTFEYNLNGIVEVGARDRTSGKTKKARFDVNRPEEVAAGPAISREGRDRSEAARADREKCRRILRSARKKLARIGDDAAPRKKIERKMEQLEKALEKEGGNPLELALELAELTAGI